MAEDYSSPFKNIDKSLRPGRVAKKKAATRGVRGDGFPTVRDIARSRNKSTKTNPFTLSRRVGKKLKPRKVL